MALLEKASAAGAVLAGAVVTLGVAGCDGRSEIGSVQYALFDVPVECDADTRQCLSADRSEVSPVDGAHTSAFLSTETSRFAPNGVYLYFEFARSSGAFVNVELDVPLEEGRGDAHLVYREYLDGALVFSSQTAYGVIEAAQDMAGEQCACADGRLELVFVDGGPDGRTGTTDDQFRRLTQTRFGWDQGFCVPALMMRVEPSVVSVHVVQNCASASPPASSGGGVSVGGEVVYETGPDYYPNDYYDYGSGSACEGDTSDDSGCDGSSGDSGCAGDSSDSGCEGDSSGSDSGCSGDSSSDCEGDTSSSDSGDCSGDSSSSSGSSGCDSNDCEGDTASRETDGRMLMANICPARPGGRRRLPANLVTLSLVALVITARTARTKLKRSA